MAGTNTTRGAPPPMAAGGTTGQVLTKASNASYDTEWTTVGGGGGGTVTDVTASAPLSSTGGATPDISIGGGTAGQVLTSNGASAPTFEDLPAPPTVPSASSSNGTSIGTAAPGISTDYARGDHVHDGSLSDLDDVSATVPTAGQVLAWGGAEWAPATPAAVPAASSSTPAGLGTAAVGVSTDYARADHVHAGTVTALTDRYEELPAQTYSEFAHASGVSASPTRDIQTAIDATPVGPACQVIVGPGSYGGATVTIPAGRNNISIIGPSAGDLGGTIATLSSSRALTIGNNAVRVRIVSLQVEGLTTVSTTGTGVHRFEQSQLLGGLTIGAISATIYVVGCEVGAVTIPAGFTGVVLFDRCSFLSSITNNATAPLTRCFISDSAGGIAAPTAAATINGRWQVGTSTTFYAGGSALLGAPLTAINSLTPAADRIAYYTSASAGAMTALTTFGRSLIDDVDAAAARTTLGLGTAATSAATAFEPADATLTALAGVTTAADKLAYFTGVDTAAVADLTAFARTLLDDADAATARTTLGLTTGTAAGNVVVLDGSAKLPAVDGSALTGVFASPFTADAWDAEWSAAAGSPVTLANYTGSANLSAVSVVGGGSFAGAAATFEGVSSWAFTPTAVSEQQELHVQPLTPVDEWELRALVHMPGEDALGTPQHFGALGKQVGTAKPQFLAGASVTGLARQNGLAEEVKIEGADVRSSWMTVTIRATRVHSGATLTSRNQIQYQLWCGEFLAGTWNGANVTDGASSAAGLIRFGKSTGTGVRVMRIASLAWRSGNNQAPPSYTYRGMGFGGGGPA